VFAVVPTGGGCSSQCGQSVLSSVTAAPEPDVRYVKAPGALGAVQAPLEPPVSVRMAVEVRQDDLAVREAGRHGHLHRRAERRFAAQTVRDRQAVRVGVGHQAARKVIERGRGRRRGRLQAAARRDQRRVRDDGLAAVSIDPGVADVDRQVGGDGAAQRVDLDDRAGAVVLRRVRDGGVAVVAVRDGADSEEPVDGPGCSGAGTARPAAPPSGARSGPRRSSAHSSSKSSPVSSVSPSSGTP
jgi:hypothetical protein